MKRTVHDIIVEHADTLRALARAGVAIEDVADLPIYNDFVRLTETGVKTTYVVMYLCEEYERSERTIWRIVRKFRRVIND